jgi:hypothetical protein
MRTKKKGAISAMRPGPHDLINEMFLVGDELSLSGRFVQQVLHVMTAVGQDLGIPIRFGDHKTVKPSERKLREEQLRRQSAILLAPSETDTNDITPTQQTHLRDRIPRERA